MSHMVASAIAIIALAAACHADESAMPAPPPGIPARPATPQPATAVPTSPAQNSWNPVNARRASSPTTNPSVSVVAISPTPADAVPATPPRDLAAELHGFVGNPTQCFAQRTAGSGASTLLISVRAMVMPSGTVTRAGVSGAGLTAQESACVEAVVMRARFRSPVDDAPRDVQTSIELREQPKVATPATAAPSSP